MGTIVAIATPPGRGGVGIVRLSGPDAYTIGLAISNLSQLKSRVATFTKFTSKDLELIDEGLIIYFKAPNSFTGEDIIEFQAHGAPIVLDRLIKECILYGARIASPGEFSERAFLNNKMDLTQAEAIADLIACNSATAARLAARSLQGDFSNKINEISAKIIKLRLYVEAAIDFPEEEIDFLADGKIINMLADLLLELEKTRKSANYGSVFRDGLAVVIAGYPNAGKSTLINALAKREVAIVTDIAGTTRDVMRENILLDDIPVHIIDTAGLRESDDIVEKEGIKKAWDEISRADCVLLMTDIVASQDIYTLSKEVILKLPENAPIIHIFNKIDKVKTQDKKMLVDDKINHVFLSAKSGDGLNILIAKIKEVAGFQPCEGQFLARRRHIQALDETIDLLIFSQTELLQNYALELFADNLRVAHEILGRITGEFSSDDLLGEIFSSFCIGK
jgi:tRNA modification GTPase